LEEVFIGHKEIYLAFENAELFEEVKPRIQSPVKKQRTSQQVSLLPNISSGGRLKRAGLSFSIAIGEINSIGYSTGPLTYLNCFVCKENQYKLGNLNFVAQNHKISMGEITNISTIKFKRDVGGEITENLDWRICPSAKNSRIFTNNSDSYTFGVLFLEMCSDVFNLNLDIENVVNSKQRIEIEKC
jgi:hypothetical protein